MACGGVICRYHEIIAEIYSIVGGDYIEIIINMLEVYPGPDPPAADSVELTRL